MENINLFDNIQKITRKSSYKTETHDGIHNNSDFKTLYREKFLEDFGLPKYTKIKASPLVFFNSSQHEEITGNDNKYLKELMNKLDIEPFYITKNSNYYAIV